MISTRHAVQERMGLTAQRRQKAAALGTPKRIVISGHAAGHDTLRRVSIPRRSPRMKTVAGVWIDRRKAIIAVISSTGDVLTEILAGVEREPSRVAGVQSTSAFEPQLVKADDRRQRGFTGHIDHFYERVVTALGATPDILVFGPGEAKGEFQKHLDQAGPRNRLVVLEAASGMSTRQILSRVRNHFQPKRG